MRVMMSIMKKLRSALLLLVGGIFLLGSIANASYNSYANFGATGSGYHYPILDKGYQLWVIETSASRLRVFHSWGNEAPFSNITQGKNASGSNVLLSGLSGLAVDTAGIIYLACNNSSSGYIYKFQSWDGKALNGFALSFLPGDLDIDSSNRLYISEATTVNAKSRVHILSSTGTAYPGSPIEISGTGTYANLGLGVQKDGTAIYQVSRTEGLLRKFMGGFSNGTASFSTVTTFLSGLTDPVACDVDRIGRIYISDPGTSTVSVLDSNGTLYQTLSGTGAEKPFGIAAYENQQLLFLGRDLTSSYLRSWGEANNLQIPVMCYHNVTACWKASHSLKISPDLFEDQLKFLKNHDYHTITPAQYYEWWMNGTSLPENPILIAFDDNYEGEYDWGGSLLKQYNGTGTIFAITKSVGANGSWWNHGSWSDFSTGEAEGFINAESHTMTHLEATSLSQSTVLIEYTNSRLAFQANMSGKTCHFLAYPYGSDTYTLSGSQLPAAIPVLAARAGYKMSFSVRGSLSSRFSPPQNIPRVGPDGDQTLNQFKQTIGYSLGRIDSDPYIVNNDGNDDGSTSGTSGWASRDFNTLADIGCYGVNYAYVNASTTAGNQTYTFTPSLGKGGSYDVYGWWPQDSVHATNTPITIHYLSGSTTVNVNQRTDGYRWVFLGRYSFAAGSAGTIVISNQANGVVAADAVKLEWVDPTAVNDFMKYASGETF